MEHTTQKSISDKKSAATVFIWLVLATALFAVIGAYASDRFGILDGMSFYGRYDGVSSALPLRVHSVLLCSVSCLVQLAFLYILSYSSLLIPGSIILTGFRGFILGASYSIADCTAEFAQIAVYAVITAGICAMASMLALCRKVSDGGVFVPKTVILTATAGFSVITELVLSFLI